MQDFLLIHLIPVDFILPLLESFKVILDPGLSQAHRGTLVGPMLSRDKSRCYGLWVVRPISKILFQLCQNQFHVYVTHLAALTKEAEEMRCCKNLPAPAALYFSISLKVDATINTEPHSCFENSLTMCVFKLLTIAFPKLHRVTTDGDRYLLGLGTSHPPEALGVCSHMKWSPFLWLLPAPPRVPLCYRMPIVVS